MQKLTQLTAGLYVERKKILNDMEKEIVDELKQKYFTNEDAKAMEVFGKLMLVEVKQGWCMDKDETCYYDIPEKEENLLKAILVLLNGIGEL